MATITLNTTANQDARIAAAIGQRLGLGRSATGPEVKQWLIEDLRRAVLEIELVNARAAADASVTEITVS